MPIKLPQTDADKLMRIAETEGNANLSIDLENQKIISPNKDETFFEIDSFRKHCLLNGLDEIGLTLEKEAKIDLYEKKMKANRPWL